MLHNLKHLEIVGSETTFGTKLLCDYSSSNIKYLKLIGLVIECIPYVRRHPMYQYNGGIEQPVEIKKNVDLKKLEEVHLENIMLNSPRDSVFNDQDDFDADFKMKISVITFNAANSVLSLNESFLLILYLKKQLI